MHKERIIPIAANTSIEPERVAESVAYIELLTTIFDRPQRVFYLTNEEGTLVKRVRVLTPVGWRVVPLNVEEYPQFVENYLE